MKNAAHASTLYQELGVTIAQNRHVPRDRLLYCVFKLLVLVTRTAFPALLPSGGQKLVHILFMATRSDYAVTSPFEIAISAFIMLQVTVAAPMLTLYMLDSTTNLIMSSTER
jgi:hypothetical protein